MLAARPVRQDLCQKSLMLSTQRIFQVAVKAPGACPKLANAEPELDKAFFGSDSGRVSLSQFEAFFGSDSVRVSLPWLSTSFDLMLLLLLRKN